MNLVFMWLWIYPQKLYSWDKISLLEHCGTLKRLTLLISNLFLPLIFLVSPDLANMSIEYLNADCVIYKIYYSKDIVRDWVISKVKHVIKENQICMDVFFLKNITFIDNVKDYLLN